MSKRRPVPTLKRKPLPETRPGEDPLAELLEDLESTPNARKRPARFMPYSMSAHPEHGGVVSLPRAARVATQHEWEKIAEQHRGKMIRAALAGLPQGEELINQIVQCVRANGISISTSTSKDDFLLLKKHG